MGTTVPGEGSKGSEKGDGKGTMYSKEARGCVGKCEHSMRDCPDSKEKVNDGGVAPVEKKVTNRWVSTKK